MYPDMLCHANISVCIVRLLKDKILSKALIRGIFIGLSLVLILSIHSCATSRHATYEAQRRGLLMLEGENIYKNKGFYKSKESQKRRRKTMRAHKRSLRR
jgi:hypothetical protein